MAKVGLIGVGNMGMGKNILKSGHELTVYDLRTEPLDQLAQLGAQAAATPKEVGKSADFVFIMVLNVDQVKEVLLSDNGLIAGLGLGGTVICKGQSHLKVCIHQRTVVGKMDFGNRYQYLRN